MSAAPKHQDGELAPVIERLDNAICELINPRGQHIEGQWASVPSLYMQLYDALPGQQGAGNHAARSMPPLWIDAVKIVAEIDTAARKWVRTYETTAFHGPNALPTIHRLETMRTASWRPQDIPLIADHAAQLEGWAIEIDQLLTPQNRWHLPNPCPACGTATVHRRDSAGELVRQPALQIGPDGCHCARCKYTWGPQYFEHLARVLGYELPAGVLE